MQTVNKDSTWLFRKYFAATAGNNFLRFQKVELQSDFFENGKRIVRHVYTLTNVSVNQIILRSAIGSMPETETVDLAFVEFSFKQY